MNHLDHNPGNKPDDKPEENKIDHHPDHRSDREKNNNQQPRGKAIVHIIWGVALVLAGVGVFYRIPQVMPKIETIKHFVSVIAFIRFSFYLLGILLVWGGVRKVYDYHNLLTDNYPDNPCDTKEQ